MRTPIVADVMTRDVATVDPGASYQQVAALIIARRVSAVPVVDGFQHVLGVVSQADLLRRIEAAGQARRLPWQGRRQRRGRLKATALTAQDLMTAPAITTFANKSIGHAARVMDDANVKRLPVIDDLGRLVGIVSRGDLLRAAPPAQVS